VKKKVPWWVIILIIILGFWLLAVLGTAEEYKSCVDECVSDIDSCLMHSEIYDSQGNAYVEDLDYESCINDLESCVDWCDY